MNVQTSWTISIADFGCFDISAIEALTGHQNPSSTYTGNSNINTSNANSVTLTAQWVIDSSIPASACTGTYGTQTSINLSINGSQEFNYTGNITCAYLQKAGYYKIEAYGAQGSTGATQGKSAFDANQNGTYGKGGYTYGTIYAPDKSAIYIAVGQGAVNTKTGGYNGGGTGDATCNEGKSYGGGGGGATHIATKTGVLSSLSSSTSSILIVAGGGGGGGGVWGNPYSGYSATYLGDGGNGGGGNTSGSTGGKAYYNGYGVNGPGSYGGGGGTPSAGGSGGSYGNYDNTAHNSAGDPGYFGSGGNSNTHECSCNSAGAGGGGYYGGGGGGTAWYNECTAGGGGGGSGYIRSTVINSGGTTGARSGNGLARVTYLGTSV